MSLTKRDYYEVLGVNRDADEAAIKSSYLNAVSTVDKAAAKGVIHKNAADRKKAQMAIKLAAK